MAIHQFPGKAPVKVQMTAEQLMGQYVQSLLQVTLGIALAVRRVSDAEGRVILDDAMSQHQFACQQLALVEVVSGTPPQTQPSNTIIGLSGIPL